MKRESLLKIRAATKHLAHVNGKIFFHVRFECLCIKAWSANISDLAVDMLLRASLTTQLIFGTLSSKHKVFSCYSHLVAITSALQDQIRTASFVFCTFWQKIFYRLCQEDVSSYWCCTTDRCQTAHSMWCSLNAVPNGLAGNECVYFCMVTYDDLQWNWCYTVCLFNMIWNISIYSTV